MQGPQTLSNPVSVHSSIINFKVILDLSGLQLSLIIKLIKLNLLLSLDQMVKAYKPRRSQVHPLNSK